MISRSGDIEVVCATMYGKDGSFEVPGGANGHKAFVRRRVIDKEHWNWGCKEFEKELKEFGEEVGVRNVRDHNRRNLHHRTTIDK